MSSSAAGSSSVERSPGSASSASARTARRTIFCERVFGSARVNSTRSARKALPSCSSMLRDSSARSSSLASRPGASTAKHQAASPLSACGMPIVQASTTAGCATSADSYSDDPTRFPATFSASSERPCRNHSPSASIDAQSPCTQTPGKRPQ